MRAILVNPFDKTVTEVNYSGDYKQIYEHIDAQLFTVVGGFAGNNDVYIDDEGLFVEPDNQEFFAIEGFEQPLAGKGLILSNNDEGESTATDLSIEEAKSKIRFISKAEVFNYFN